MARVIVGGSLEFDALAYGKPHPNTLQFLQNQSRMASEMLTETGREWFSGIKQIYQHVDQSDAMRFARAVGRKVRSMWEIDEIRTLNDIGQFQHAGPNMQRWIMAEPTVRTLYHQQKCDGYSEQYHDYYPGLVGEKHYDYRRVMDGIVTSDNPDIDWQASNYFEELLPDDMDLLHDEQLDILATWDRLKQHLIKGKEDPTSVWNAEL